MEENVANFLSYCDGNWVICTEMLGILFYFENRDGIPIYICCVVKVNARQLLQLIFF